MTTMTDTRTLQVPHAEIAYDITEALGGGSEHAPLIIIGQPMTAEGFEALANELTDRTVVRYDPRGLGRSTRSDGSNLHDPTIQAEDLHALALEVSPDAPVDVFASSGGAVAGLAWVAAYPDDIRVLVAHEPPVLAVLPDADAAFAAAARTTDLYQRGGFGLGMAGFIQFVTHQGEFTDEYTAQPDPNPAMFGLPIEDDGSRNDPLMGGASAPVTDYRPDLHALRAADSRIVFGVGETSGQIATVRATNVLATELGGDVVTFRGGHGGFSADEWGTPGDPAKFADQLRAALDA